MTKLILVFALALPIFAQTFAKMPVVTNCGVVGNLLADDTATIQACINSAPDDSEIVFPSGATMKITATINIHNRFGLKLVGQMGRFGGPSAGTPAPGFYWFGPDGGTMFDYDRADNIVTESLLFFNAPGYIGGVGGASILINVDQTLAPPGTTTANLFQRNSFISGTNNPNFVGIRFAQVSGINVEAMTVEKNYLSCSYGAKVGRGIMIGPGGFYNAKKHLYQDNTISNCDTDIYLTGGSADILNNKFNLSKTNIYGSPIDPIKIDGNDAENLTQFFVGNLTAPITISDNRIAAANPPTGQGAVWIIGAGHTLTVTGNQFDPWSSYMPVAFASHNGGSLDSSGNTYPAGLSTFAGFLTATGRFTSHNDSGLSGPMQADGGYNPGGYYAGGGYFGKFGGMVFDDSASRWKMSNDLSSPSASTSHMILSEPAASVSLSGAHLGTCASGTDLVSNSSGTNLSSASLSFSSYDAGGYVHIDAVNGWNAGDYYINGSPGAHQLAPTDPPSVSMSGGSFTVNRGRMVLVQGASGIADTLWVCVQAATGYAWKQVF